MQGNIHPARAIIRIWLLIGRQRWGVTYDLPGPLPMRIIGFLLGILSALMGISGGMLTNMTMLMLGRSIHQAVAASAGLGVFIAIPGAIGYALAGWAQTSALPAFSLGYVSVPRGNLAFGPRHVAHAIPRRRLELASAAYLLTMSARFVVALVW